MQRLALGMALLLAACSSAPVSGDSIATGSAPLAAPPSDPVLEFYANAPDPRDLALTFDDGPDDVGYTDQILDVLRDKGVKASFFINTDNAVNVDSSTRARRTVERIVAEGHELGSHTAHHYDLGKSSTDVRSELRAVRALMRDVVPSSLQHRLTRAPYGNPYFGPQWRLDEVSPLIARDGVHIGWNIDSLDWKCQSASSEPETCIHNNVLSEVDRGKNGLVLLHSIHPATAAVLGRLIDTLKSRGMRFVGTEELVVAKYGKGSRHLLHCDTNEDCSPGDVCGPARRCQPSPPAPPPDTETTELRGWSAVAETPERTGNAFAWIGGEAVLFGGVGADGKFLRSAVAYEPTRGSWRMLPAGPLSARADAAFGSSHTRLFVFGGRNETYARMTSAAIYDSPTNTWIRLPKAPHTMRCAPRVVWAETTREFIVYGCARDAGAKYSRPSGMAINPATKTWREIRSSPLTAVEGFAIGWASDRMVVWGGADERFGGPHGAIRAAGAAYDPVKDAWTILPTAPIAGRYGASVVATASRLYVIGGYTAGAASKLADGAAYDASSDRWETVTSLSEPVAEAASWTDGATIWLVSGDHGWSYDPPTSSWRNLPPSPLSRAVNAAWTGSAGFVSAGGTSAMFTP